MILSGGQAGPQDDVLHPPGLHESGKLGREPSDILVKLIMTTRGPSQIC